MNTWRIKTQRLDQIGLADEMATWLAKVRQGVFLFREGPTLSEFQWGNAHDVSAAELSRTWIVRLFCREFEIYARRINYEAGNSWQVRIAAAKDHLRDGEELITLDEQTQLLLGEATGDGEEFAQKPFRYRRGELRYPGQWQWGDSCGLWTRRFQPKEGGAIVCWQKLDAVPSDSQSAHKTQ
jgi:hypothetical protein